MYFARDIADSHARLGRSGPARLAKSTRSIWVLPSPAVRYHERQRMPRQPAVRKRKEHWKSVPRTCQQRRNSKRSAKTWAMQRAAGDRLIDVEIAVADLDIEAALRIRAGPRLEMDSRALASKVRERHEIAGFALLTLGKGHLHRPPPAVPRV